MPGLKRIRVEYSDHWGVEFFEVITPESPDSHEKFRKLNETIHFSYDDTDAVIELLRNLGHEVLDERTL